MIEQGMKAPDFSLPDSEGKTWTLGELCGGSGKPGCILYFYPRDDTPGCTVEACSFRDNFGEFAERGIRVVGVSPDSPAAHAKFKAKYSLPFILLSDPEKQVLVAYGAYGEKMMYGKKVMGVIRSTFIIGGDGIVVKVFPKVTPADHATKILEGL
ncbi:MAG: peroxiredoxin [Spirochaetae bacterium HGW-Spirochaetae-9]|nr:MAG: peroxiredoxin [Spirochaetae bacterium HGW-Spirochaetae-9]